MFIIIMKEKIIAFDLDGTIIDSAPDLTSALNYVLNLFNLENIDEKEVRSLIGNGAEALINEAFKKKGKNIENMIELKNVFLDKYKICFKDKTKLYPDAEKVIKRFYKSGYTLILVSNKPEFYCRELLTHFKIMKYFSSVSGGDTFSYRKPDPRHLFETINKTGISNHNTIFIGDSIYDYECAKNAKLPCILLSHGYSNININKLNAYKVIPNFSLLFEIIDDYMNSKTTSFNRQS